jgi:hypothetical protein
LGEQDENGIVRLNIDLLICIKSIVLWPNLGKMMAKFPRNSSVTAGRNGVLFSGMIEDTM